MIKHCIMIKLKNSSKEAKDDLVKRLLSMNGKVSMMDNLEVLSDFLCSERSYDVFLSCTLADEAALDAYQQDPYHLSVKEYIKTVAESIIALDSYID